MAEAGVPDVPPPSATNDGDVEEAFDDDVRLTVQGVAMCEGDDDSSTTLGTLEVSTQAVTWRCDEYVAYG